MRAGLPIVGRMRCAALLILALLAACGQSTAPVDDVARPARASPPAAVAAPTVDAADLLAGIPAAAAAAGSVTYDAVTESGLDGGPPTVDARLSGVLDTTADAGTAQLEIDALGPDLAAQAEAAGEVVDRFLRFELTWTATDLTGEFDGERETAPRDASDTALIARVPGEPAGLFDVVAAATEAIVVGQEDVAGVPATHLRASARPQAAVEAGLGTQAQLAIAQLPDLPVEVWVDADGRPVRIRYTVVLPSVQDGRTRTLVTTYDYTGWGEPVDVTP